LKDNIIKRGLSPAEKIKKISGIKKQQRMKKSIGKIYT
jgi:hypothetical protein